MKLKFNHLYFCAPFLPMFSRIAFPLIRDKKTFSVYSMLSDPQILATFILFFLSVSIIIKNKFIIKYIISMPLVFCLLFILASIISIIYSSNKVFSAWRTFEVISIYIWSLGALSYLKEYNDLRRLLNTYIAMSILMLAGFGVSFILFPNEAWRVGQVEKVSRLVSSSFFMMGSNTIGEMSSILISILLLRYIISGAYKYLILLPILLVINYYSFSRTGFIILFVCLIYLYVLTNTVFRKFSNIAFSNLMMFSVILALLVGGIYNKVLYTFTRGASVNSISTLNSRTILWNSGFKIAEKNNYIGTGYGVYGENNLYVGTHLHNMFIEILVTLGLAGLIIIAMLFLYLIIKIIMRNIKYIFSGNNDFILYCITIIFISTFIQQMTSAGAAYYSIDMVSLYITILSVDYYNKMGKQARNGVR